MPKPYISKAFTKIDVDLWHTGFTVANVWSQNQLVNYVRVEVAKNKAST